MDRRAKLYGLDGDDVVSGAGGAIRQVWVYVTITSSDEAAMHVAQDGQDIARTIATTEHATTIVDTTALPADTTREQAIDAATIHAAERARAHQSPAANNAPLLMRSWILIATRPHERQRDNSRVSP
jgi:hypothetical protein